MVSIEEARRQVESSRQSLAQRQQEAQQYEQQLQQQRQQILSEQALRTQPQFQRQQSLQRLQEQEQGLQQYQGQLTQFESGQLAPAESELRSYEEQRQRIEAARALAANKAIPVASISDPQLRQLVDTMRYGGSEASTQAIGKAVIALQNQGVSAERAAQLVAKETGVTSEQALGAVDFTLLNEAGRLIPTSQAGTYQVLPINAVQSPFTPLQSFQPQELQRPSSSIEPLGTGEQIRASIRRYAGISVPSYQQAYNLLASGTGYEEYQQPTGSVLSFPIKAGERFAGIAGEAVQYGIEQAGNPQFTTQVEGATIPQRVTTGGEFYIPPSTQTTNVAQLAGGVTRFGLIGGAYATPVLGTGLLVSGTARGLETATNPNLTPGQRLLGAGEAVGSAAFLTSSVSPEFIGRYNPAGRVAMNNPVVGEFTEGGGLLYQRKFNYETGVAKRDLQSVIKSLAQKTLIVEGVQQGENIALVGAKTTPRGSLNLVAAAKIIPTENEELVKVILDGTADIQTLKGARVTQKFTTESIVRKADVDLNNLKLDIAKDGSASVQGAIGQSVTKIESVRAIIPTKQEVLTTPSKGIIGGEFGRQMIGQQTIYPQGLNILGENYFPGQFYGVSAPGGQGVTNIFGGEFVPGESYGITRNRPEYSGRIYSQPTESYDIFKTDESIIGKEAVQRARQVAGFSIPEQTLQKRALSLKWLGTIKPAKIVNPYVAGIKPYPRFSPSEVVTLRSLYGLNAPTPSEAIKPAKIVSVTSAVKQPFRITPSEASLTITSQKSITQPSPRTLEKLGTLSKKGFEESLKPDSSLRGGTSELPQVKRIQQPIERMGQRNQQRTNQRQQQQTKQVSVTQTIQTLEPRVSVSSTIPLPKIGKFKFKLPKIRGTRKIGKAELGVYGLEVRKRGKFEKVESGADIQKLIRSGAERVSRSLAASFRVVERGGRVVNIPIPEGFRPSKREIGVAVQPRGRRLGTRAEVFEIQISKKLKGRRR